MASLDTKQPGKKTSLSAHMARATEEFIHHISCNDPFEGVSKYREKNRKSLDISPLRASDTRDRTGRCCKSPFLKGLKSLIL